MVSAPFRWDELDAIELEDFTLATMPRALGRRSATSKPASTTAPTRCGPLLELAAHDEAEGLGDAPWPPNFPKADGEPVRAQPSRRQRAGPGLSGSQGRAHPG